MSILIGIGVISTVTVLYLGRKGWFAFHKAVGITPGVLIYQDEHTPLPLSHIKWQRLNLNKKHLNVLSNKQLNQLQSIDKKLAIYRNYQNYQKEQQVQNTTPALTEQQFVLHKMVQTRLPEILSSYYQLTHINIRNDTKDEEKQAEAGKLLQEALGNIEDRLDELLEQLEEQHLKALRVMKHYIESHNN